MLDGQARVLGREGGANKSHGSSYFDLCNVRIQVFERALSHGPSVDQSVLVGSQKRGYEDPLAWELEVVSRKENGGLGFCEMEASNDALLAKQVWQLFSNETSPVAKVLSAKYCPNSIILDAELGVRLSFVWRSIWGSRKLILKGSRWLIRNGENIDIWKDRWLPRPRAFRPITPKPSVSAVSRVCELIDTTQGDWNEALIKEIFLPCDSEVILSIPLCMSWPRDKVVWHYTTNGAFSVRSAYHLLLEETKLMQGCLASDEKGFWSTIWSLEVPRRVRILAWRLAKNLLPTGCNLARRIQTF